MSSFFGIAQVGLGAPPSPSPERPRKRKREDEQGDYGSPTRRPDVPVPVLSFDGSQNFPRPSANIPFQNMQHTSHHPPLPRNIAYPRGWSSPHAVSPQVPAHMQQVTPPPSDAHTTPSIPSAPVPPSVRVPSGTPFTPSSSSRSPQPPLTYPLPPSHLLLSLPALLVQQPNHPLYLQSSHASVSALRHLLNLHATGRAEYALPADQECYARLMLAEMGMVLIDYQMHRASSATTTFAVPLPHWIPGAPEIEQSIAKALILVEHNQSLRHLRHRLTLMHATLVHWQGNNKHARVLLKGLLPPASLVPMVGFNGVNPTADTAWAGYEAHLTIVHQILTSTAVPPNIPTATSAPSVSKEKTSRGANAGRFLSHNDLAVALSHLSAMSILAQTTGDAAVIQVCAVIKLTILVQNERWSEAGQVLKEVEGVLGLGFTEKEGEVKTEEDTKTPSVYTATPFGMSAGTQTAWLQPNLHTPAFPAPVNALAANPFAAISTPQLQAPLQTQPGVAPIQVSAKQTNIIPSYLCHLRIQVLTLGVLYLTHKGESNESAKRLTLLHEMMDALSGMPTNEESDHGVLEIPLTSNPSKTLRIQCAHPRVLYHLTYAASSVAKRDLVGRRPKKKVFAHEGVCQHLEAELGTVCSVEKVEGIPGKLTFAPGLGLLDVEKTYKTLVEIRADIYVELITACIARSEFDEGELHLNDLIAHLRTYDLWDAFSGRVCLLQGYSAHAMGRTRRALECYRAVQVLSAEDSLIWALGWIGEIGLRIGFGSGPIGPSTEEWMAPQLGYDEIVAGVMETCLSGTWGLGMVCIGRVLEACFSGEIVRAKQQLNFALNIASQQRDNYMRLLILCLTAGHYVHTYSEYALKILGTCRQLAAGLGAAPQKTPAGDAQATQSQGRTQDKLELGHVRAGLWVGERFLALSKRTGDATTSTKQGAINSLYGRAIKSLEQRAKDEDANDYPALQTFSTQIPHDTHVKPALLKLDTQSTLVLDPVDEYDALRSATSRRATLNSATSNATLDGNSSVISTSEMVRQGGRRSATPLGWQGAAPTKGSSKSSTGRGRRSAGAESTSSKGRAAARKRGKVEE